MTTCKVHLLKRPTKLPSGRRVQYWTLRWSDRRGRQRYKSIGRVGKVTRSEAESAKRQMIIALGTGKARQDKPCRLTPSQFLDFPETAFGHGMRATTLIEWRNAGRHAIDALTDKPLEEVTWADVAEIRGHMDRLGKSEATIYKTLRMLKALLGRAVKRHMIVENPFAGEYMGEKVVKTKRIFSPAEIDAMIEAAPSLMWQALIQLAVTSGLRKSELLHLRWEEDVDLDACTVRVQGRRGGPSILAWEPKTARSTRTVPLPLATVDLLRRLKIKSGGSPYLFIDLNRLAVIDARMSAGKLRPNFDLINNFTRRFE